MRRLVVLTVPAAAAACATLGQLGAIVQPPRFEEVDGRPAELRVVGPSAGRVLGGADVRLWTEVTNSNPFGFTLSSLQGTLFLEDGQAATADFPLGLPLAAGARTVIPIDLAIDFTELPGLAQVIRRAASGQPIGYRLDGTVGIDAGRLGTPTFGPMTIVRGRITR
jgi:hypothetical protein